MFEIFNLHNDEKIIHICLYFFKDKESTKFKKLNKQYIIITVALYEYLTELLQYIYAKFHTWKSLLYKIYLVCLFLKSGSCLQWCQLTEARGEGGMRPPDNLNSPPKEFHII